jgi:hypothetical protein
MLTKLRIKNFKQIESAEIDLASAVVFVGQNNSGKTTALQALALWEKGLKRWAADRPADGKSKKRTGVTLNRRDLVALPIPSTPHIWTDLHYRVSAKEDGKPTVKQVLIEIGVDGISKGRKWTCDLEFAYGNPETIYCRPLRLDSAGTNWSELPSAEIIDQIKLAFLPPMSGLASVEPKWEPGRVSVLIGEGQTAQVLRNLCYNLHQSRSSQNVGWDRTAQICEQLFKVELTPPEYDATRGEITMKYRDTSRNGIELDISAAGRGLQQTMLLLSYFFVNPGTTILLDEPDAHLETLRQRQIYDLLVDTARSLNGQIIAASHSEVVLNQAAGRDTVVGFFLGKPRVMNDRGSQLLKSLQSIGFDHYMRAMQTGWVLYLEGSSDLAILKEFAKKLGHPVEHVLGNCFVHFVSTNVPSIAHDHFFGLKEARPDLIGVAIFDRLTAVLESDKNGLSQYSWKRREIENYLCTSDTLLAYARGPQASDLFEAAEVDRRVTAMEEAINSVAAALDTLAAEDKKPWSNEIKASDDFLSPVFRRYFQTLQLPASTLSKHSFHELVTYVPVNQIDMEMTDVLNRIHDICKRARPFNG